MVICQAINCTSNYNHNPSVHYFRFPTDAARCRIWLERCGNASLLEKRVDELHRFRLCGIHFARSAFMNDNRNKLVHDAVPTIFQTTGIRSRLEMEIGLGKHADETGLDLSSSPDCIRPTPDVGLSLGQPELGAKLFITPESLPPKELLGPTSSEHVFGSRKRLFQEDTGLLHSAQQPVHADSTSTSPVPSTSTATSPLLQPPIKIRLLHSAEYPDRPRTTSPVPGTSTRPTTPSLLKPPMKNPLAGCPVLIIEMYLSIK